MRAGYKKKTKRHKKKKISTMDYEMMPRISSRGFKEGPNYDEAAMDFDLSETDDGEDAIPEEKGESQSTRETAVIVLTLVFRRRGFYRQCPQSQA